MPAPLSLPPPAPADEVAPRGRAPWGRLLSLFGYSLVNWSVGNGLLPILPSIAASLGADEFVTGLYLAASYVALAAGTLLAGFVADRVGHRRALMIGAGLVSSPLILLISWASSLWQLAVLTAATWCVAGMAVTLATIETGLLAGPRERGRVLGFLAAAPPLGSVLGGLGVGPLADAVGYQAMWIDLGLLVLLAPAFAFLLRPDPPAPRYTDRARGGMTWTVPFLLLFVCGIVGAYGTFVGGLGRSFAMKPSFSNGAITSTVAVSGIVALPVTLLMGALSDRWGRLPFMGLCYAAGIAGLGVYAIASSLVDYWIAASLLAFISYVSTGVGGALVVDLVDRSSVGRGLAYFGATGWIGAIGAFAGGGYLFATGSLATGFLVGAGFVGVGVVLLLGIRATAPTLRPARPSRSRGGPEVRKG